VDRRLHGDRAGRDSGLELARLMEEAISCWPLAVSSW
jgi:hypothetical protein